MPALAAYAGSRGMGNPSLMLAAFRLQAPSGSEGTPGMNATPATMRTDS
jgi:hypothetical protein